jgi:hypothetical protein
MTDLLERVRAEIRERLESSRAAVEEYERLRAAAAALGESTESAGPVRRSRLAVARPRQRARPANGSPAKRAPRGANREAVLRVLAERPGVSAAELAATSGVARPVLYTLLARLVERGEVVKESLPGGAMGYALAREGVVASGSPASTAIGDRPRSASE